MRSLRIARFVSETRVMCMSPSGNDDPNCDIYQKIYHDLCQMTDAEGRKMEVIRVPSPGLVHNDEGEIMPASYMNFVITNACVVVPVYGTAYDRAAVAKIAECFPGRKTVGLRSNALLTGGGSFHCITQQGPRS